MIPCGDFSLYEHVLDTAWALGAIPSRFGAVDRESLGDYFGLARGTAEQRPLEMTKWFDTNYHNLVPELDPGQRFELHAEHWTGPLREAAALGIQTRPVVLGPLSFPLLSKGLDRPLDLLGNLAKVYAQLLGELSAAGATEIQVDEPCLALDRSREELVAFAEAWHRLSAASEADLCLATYFAGLDPGVLNLIAGLVPAELHLDLVRAPEQLAPALRALRDITIRLSLGALDGRNVWVADPDCALDWIDAASAALGAERITIAPSCSLLHVPYEAAREEGIDPEIRPSLAFCAEKLAELALLRAAVIGVPSAMSSSPAPARSSPPGAPPPTPTTPPSGSGSAHWSRATTSGPHHSASDSRCRQSASTCRSCRRRRSAPTRRPTQSAPPAANCAKAISRRAPTAISSAARSTRLSPSRRRSGSMSSSTASPSATTWSSTSASNSPASPSRPPAGCSPTEAAA